LNSKGFEPPPFCVLECPLYADHLIVHTPLFTFSRKIAAGVSVWLYARINVKQLPDQRNQLPSVIHHYNNIITFTLYKL